MPWLAAAGAAGGATAAGAGAGAAGAGALGAGAAGAGAAGAGAAGAGAAAGMGAAGAAGAGTGVTAAGLGSGAIGTGMTGAGLASAPSIGSMGAGMGSAAIPSAASTVSSSSPIGGMKGLFGGGDKGMLGQIQQGVNLANSVQDLIGPQGSLSRGDMKGAINDAGSIIGSGKSIGKSFGLLGGDEDSPTTMSKFGLTPEQFAAIPPEVRQALLKQVMGR